MSGFGTLQPRTGNKDSVKLDEVIEMHKFPADEWSQIRCLPGKILPVKRHWITIIAGKEKKEITIPRYCIAFDPNHEGEPRKDAKGKEIKCPYCELTHGKDGSARYEFFYLGNAIIRELQEDEPRKKAEHTKEEKKSGHKDIRSKSWTPVRVCRFTSTMASRIQEIGEGNSAKTKDGKKTFDVTHEKYGCDIRVKFKPKAPGTDKYSIDKDERTPLTDDEKKYLTWKLDDSLLDVTGRMDQKQAQEDFKRMEIVGGDTPDDDDDDDGYNLGDDDKRSKKSKKKSKAFSDDDEDDEPKKKKKKSKPAFSDDDDDDDEPKKKKGKKKSKSDDDDDEDDEPKKSKKTKGSKDKKAKSKDKVKSKKSKSDDDDDEPKKSKKSKADKSSKGKKDKGDKKSSKGKKSNPWDDDDE